MQGLGSKKITERTGVSNTQVGRIRNRLIKRLGRKGECLPGCDRDGRRTVQKESARFIIAVDGGALPRLADAGRAGSARSEADRPWYEVGIPTA